MYSSAKSSFSLPTQLILFACEPTQDISRITDSKDGSEFDFVTFGNIEFNNSSYVFGANYGKYIQQLKLNKPELSLQVLEILEDESTNHSLLSSDIHLSHEDFTSLVGKIRHLLNTIAVSRKY